MNSLSEVLLSLPVGTRFELGENTYIRQDDYVDGMDVVLFCQESHKMLLKEGGYIILNADGTIYTEPVSYTLFGFMQENGMMECTHTTDGEINGMIVCNPFKNEYGTRSTVIGVLV